MNLSAMLSVSIGLLNLFPVPLLDGGHLLFYGIEAVRGGRCRNGRRKLASGSGWRWW
jgi:membrane-associated protease RseP (regulator of RpoE activity)